MKYVYLLVHVYDYGEDEEHEELKILGIYSSKQKAGEALDRYFKLPGFEKYPKDCLNIDQYPLNKDKWWTEGFFNWSEEQV